MSVLTCSPGCPLVSSFNVTMLFFISLGPTHSFLTYSWWL